MFPNEKNMGKSFRTLLLGLGIITRETDIPGHLGVIGDASLMQTVWKLEVAKGYSVRQISFFTGYPSHQAQRL